MKTLWQSFFLLLATATDKELARQVQLLKVKNDILRRKLPRRITVTARERQRLLKYGKAVGDAIKQLITIVSPRTFLRWLRGETVQSLQRPARVGRPRTEAEIRELVLRLAREYHWGYTRILGELKKLGVHNLSRSTVVNMLRAAGIDTSPERGRGTWAEFLQRHAATLWACDFFTKRVWTMTGPVDYFVLFFLHLGSRKVCITDMTPHPDGPWVVQQARNFNVLAAGQPAVLLRDYDTKFTKAFDALLTAAGVEVIKVGPGAPNLHAHAERWV